MPNSWSHQNLLGFFVPQFSKVEQKSKKVYPVPGPAAAGEHGRLAAAGAGRALPGQLQVGNELRLVLLAAGERSMRLVLHAGRC